MATNGGPMTYIDYHRRPGTVSLEPSFESSYNAGVKEGIRWERENQLRDMAKAAMQGMVDARNLVMTLADVNQVAKTAFLVAEAMLAESERRNDEK